MDPALNPSILRGYIEKEADRKKQIEVQPLSSHEEGKPPIYKGPLSEQKRG